MHARITMLLTGSPTIGLYQEIRRQLLRERFEVIECSDMADILAAFTQSRPPGMILIGPGVGSAATSLAIASRIRAQQPILPIVLVIEDSREEDAIAALRLKVSDYFRLPCRCDEIVTSVRRLLRDTPVKLQAAAAADATPELIGESQSILQIKAYLRKAAASDSNVLITGETGTGKELAARLLHHYSKRCTRPLITINCAALPETLLESELFGYEAGAFTGANSRYEGKLRLAHEGTLFLDEIGEMSLCAQAKILRAVEAKEIYALGSRHGAVADFRIIAATNQDLKTLLQGYGFRKDLYFRLNVVRIHLPPLRERKEDIPLLLQHYLTELGGRCGYSIQHVSEEALDCLFQYDWPGNVRELRNLAEILLLNAASTTLSAADLPEQFRTNKSDRMVPSERQLLLSTLQEMHWNKSKAAQQLHWSRMTLYRKMAKYGIQQETPAGCPDTLAPSL
ncbi:MAG: sigma-54 dependent transcriptional regulator [Candidatus Competibacteraceae bacterium]